MPKTWKMKDGVEVHICDMDNQHLRNAIMSMRRKATEYKLGGVEILESIESDPAVRWPIYNDMIDEAYSRGLDPSRWR